MKKLIYISILLITFGCGTRRWGQEEVRNYPLPIPRKVFLYTKGPCADTCQTFNLTIYDSGMAIYEDNRSGVNKFEKGLDIEQLDQLIKEFKDAKFFRLKDEYIARKTSKSTTSIEFIYKGKRKKVKYHDKAPEKLRLLEKKLDVIINSGMWFQSK